MRAIYASLFLFLFLAVLSFAQQPTPHGVAGYIFGRGGTVQVPEGTNFLVNNTNSLDFVKSTTGSPLYTGRYSVSLFGADSDNVTVLAWNLTNYGNATFSLSGDMDDINFNLSITRPSEVNATIYPSNDSRYNLSVLLNFSSNITILGGRNGTSCFATLNFSQNLIFGFTSSRLVSLGNILLGQTVQANWSVRANQTGKTNATAIGFCTSDGYNFEGVSAATTYNLTVVDEVPPVVTLIYPLNNTLNSTHRNITFFYNVSDASNVTNCSLVINGVFNQTTGFVVQSARRNFSAYLLSAEYNWSVNCTDSFGNNGSADYINLTLDVPSINVSSPMVSDPVALSAGSTQLVWCNGSVAAPLRKFNATIFALPLNASSPDNNNTHYSNSSCINNTGNYSCSFNVLYHANNGTWQCNLTSTNYEGVVNSTNVTFEIQQLVAIDISSALINYGSVAAGNTSGYARLNITNAGNSLLDVGVYSYGAIADDTLAFNCTIGNVSAEYQKVSTNNTSPFSSMLNVSGNSTNPTNVTLGLAKRITAPISNATYWRMSAPAGPARNCSGVVVFTAYLH